MKKLNKLIEKIKEVTGIEVALYLKDKLTSVSLTEEMLKTECAAIEGEEIKIFENNTYFLIKLNSLSYIVKLSSIQSPIVVSLIKQLIYSIDIDDYDSMSKESKIRKLLLGELNEMRKMALQEELKTLDFYAVGFITDTHAKLVELENFLDTVKDKKDILVETADKFIMFYRKASKEYNNAQEFATVLYENVKEELRIDLKVAVVGEIIDFHTFENSYIRAKETYELGKIFAQSQNVWLYRNFAINKLLATCDKKTLKSTLETLVLPGSENVWEDEELMVTADAFIDNSLNISETSRVLYIHRNTLMYRLDKIERETGYNLRSFADAVVFKTITTLKNILQQN